MSKVLIIAEHDGRHINQSTARCLSCAMALDAAGADVLVAGADVAGLAAEAAELAGVSRVRTLEHSANTALLAATLAPQIASLSDGYKYILGPSTTFGKDLMPRVAALLGVGQISDIMAVEGPRTFRRPIYAGNALVTVEAPADRIIIATVRTASFTAAGSAAAAPIEAVAAEVNLPTHTRFVELKTSGDQRADLQTAKIVISGGRGVGSAENFDKLYQLAGRLGAAVGASRAAVDAGYVPNELQVGQTGKIIAPDLYMALGISGAIQHLTGIKDAGTIVAINKDPDAPIFEIADIGLVGDLFQAISQLEEQLG